MACVIIAPVYCVSISSVYVCVQACRGSELDDGVETDTSEDCGQCEYQCEYQSIPCDTVVAYATVPGILLFVGFSINLKNKINLLLASQC